MKRQKIRRRTVRRGPTGPRRQKTYEEIVALDPKNNEYYHEPKNDVTFRLEDIGYDRMISMGDLLAKYYRINEEQPPLVVVLIDEPSQLIRGEKIYQVVMRGNFYIIIEPNQSTTGPHRCQLWFKSFTDRRQHWLASCQMMAFFFNQEEVKQQIMELTAQKAFFMLPQNYDIPILP